MLLDHWASHRRVPRHFLTSHCLWPGLQPCHLILGIRCPSASHRLWLHQAHLSTGLQWPPAMHFLPPETRLVLGLHWHDGSRSVSPVPSLDSRPARPAAHQCPHDHRSVCRGLPVCLLLALGLPFVPKRPPHGLPVFYDWTAGGGGTTGFHWSHSCSNGSQSQY